MLDINCVHLVDKAFANGSQFVLLATILDSDNFPVKLKSQIILFEETVILLNNSVNPSNRQVLLTRYEAS